MRQANLFMMSAVPLFGNGQRICSERFGCQPGIMDGTTECLLNEGSICLVWNYEQHIARSGDQYFHSAGPDLG